MKIQALSKQTNAGNRSQKHSKAYLQYYLLPTGTAIAHCTNKSKKNTQKKTLKKLKNLSSPPETCLLLLRLAARPVQFPLLVEPQELHPSAASSNISHSHPMKYPHQISPP
jgi:hypothetical protein